MAEVIDPFGESEAPTPEPQGDPWQPVPAAPATPVPSVVQGADGKVVLTFKGGRDFDAPWVVVHASSLDDALSYVTEGGAKLADLFHRVQKAAGSFRAASPDAGQTGAAAAPQRQAPPAGATGAPAGSPPAPGPDWVYKTGITKSGPNAGKQWHGWMPPQGSQDKPTFFNL